MWIFFIYRFLTTKVKNISIFKLFYKELKEEALFNYFDFI